MFRTKYIYIKLSRNLIEVTDLDKAETATQLALVPFSSVRNVVGSFPHALDTIRLAFKALDIKTGFFLPVKVLIQQLEGLEGGLSDIEKRALRDLAELAGAHKVFLLEQGQPLSVGVALKYLQEIKYG